MSEQLITTEHVEKIGHKLQEIRERALLNVTSKLERGFEFDNKLARSRELLLKLFAWFHFDARTIRHHRSVLELIDALLLHDQGQLLIDLFTPKVLVNDLLAIQPVVKDVEGCQALLDKILKYVERNDAAVVPPLDLAALESAKSEPQLRSTSPSIQKLVQSAPERNYYNTEETKKIHKDPFRRSTLVWQWLIEADRHVLKSVTETLSGSDPAAILNSCDFFTDVLLHDFPAEVFIQRPTIIMHFYELLWSSPSSRIATAILTALLKLTQNLSSRINYYNEPKTHNLKLNNYHIERTTKKGDEIIINSKIECIEETERLMKEQMNIPQFCLNNINKVFEYLHTSPEFKRKHCLQGTNKALLLLNDSITLLKQSTRSTIWFTDSKNVNIATIQTQLNGVLTKFGEILQYFRIKVLAEDFNEISRLIQLHLLCTFAYFLPESVILPPNLQQAIAESIVDPSLRQLFPRTHESLLQMVNDALTASEVDEIETYRDVTMITQAMSATITFSRRWKSLPFEKCIELMKTALASLEFHMHLNVIRTFIDLCATKALEDRCEGDTMKRIEVILLKLMSHKEIAIRHETYSICQQLVIKTIGAKYNKSMSSAPGSQVLFLLRQNILTLIASHGMHDCDEDIQRLSEDMLIHILKCKILVTDKVWQRALEALIPTLPLLLVQVNDAESLIGRNVLSLLDPDRSALVNLAQVDVMRLNAGLLFVRSQEARLEAVSRLCWLLSTSKPEAEHSQTIFLPRLSNLHDKSLTTICILEQPINYTTFSNSQLHFYQPSSLQQVLDLLSTPNIEPVIRRSAITQVSAMMEDPILHSIFLGNNGLEMVKKIMRSALTESDYTVYPDSIIPCLSLLKNLALYHSSVRFHLSQADDFLALIMRSIFMFNAEERVKNNGSILLFLLVFCDYVRGTPVKNDLCLPHLLQTKLKCPFEAETYLTRSQYEMESLQKLKNNKWALKSIQIHWNIEWFDGLDALLSPNLSYGEKDEFSASLKLTSNDLLAVKSSSIEYLMEKYLNRLHSTQNFSEAMELVQKLTMCLNLYELVKSSISINCDRFEWETSLSRYLSAPPAGRQDKVLLSHIVDFLSLLLPYVKHSSTSTWLFGLLKSKTHYFNELLATDLNVNHDIEVEMLINSLLALIDQASWQNDRLFNSFKHPVISDTKASENFPHIVVIIVENIQISIQKQFFKVAYLNRLLDTLVHITSSVGWSLSKPAEPVKSCIRQLCSALFAILNYFHFGKGPTANDCFMGLSITRNTLMILSHLLVEVQYFDVMDWEDCFMGNDITDESTVQSLARLTQNRDMLSRSTSLNILVGLAMSKEAAIEMNQNSCLYASYINLWALAFNILCDPAEACMVREKGALLLTNFSAHYVSLPHDNFHLEKGILPIKLRKNEELNTESQRRILIALLDSCNFYVEVEMLLKRLFTADEFNFFTYRQKLDPTYESEIEQNEFMLIYHKTIDLSSFSDSLISNFHPGGQLFEQTYSIATSGLVQSVASFLGNLVTLLQDALSGKLQELGLITLFFKCVTLPNTHCDVSTYSDILEMNTAIFSLLSNATMKNKNCLLTIGSLTDCLDTTVTLLNPDLFYIATPQLLHVRNQLWTRIYDLLTNLFSGAPLEPSENNKCNVEALILVLEHRKEPFFRALYASITSKVSNDLQHSALNSLTSLLQVSIRSYEKRLQTDEEENIRGCEFSSSSVQKLLDSTKSPQWNKQADGERMLGAELCSILIDMYTAALLSQSAKNKQHSIVRNTLTGLLLISNEAKQFALSHGLLPILIEQLRQICARLSLEHVDALRKLAERKRLQAILHELEGVLGVLMNFFYNHENAKNAASEYPLADLIHKLWNWLNAQRSLLTIALKMLATFTAKCRKACATLPLTTNQLGAGPRKTPSGKSLLHALCHLIQKEMEQVSRSHSLEIFQTAFSVLQNVVGTSNGRFIISKNNFLSAFTKLHPQITKRQKQWEPVELSWLQFLHALSVHPEGQLLIAKMQDVCDIVIALGSSPKSCNRIQALRTMRNIAFHPANKPRLLVLDDFFNLLTTRLASNIIAEANIVVSILWAMTSNSHKTKLLFKCANLKTQLQQYHRSLQTMDFRNISEGDLERLHYVINLLT